eukprot:SM000098S25158  [mRNA]  locus=s98:435091:435813:- [translate_table: standard]
MGAAPAPPPLALWLYFVALVRLVSVYFGYFAPGALRAAVYSTAGMTDLHARTFAVWTSLSCGVCALCAADLGCRPLRRATFLSFAVALAHFVAEYSVYKTMTLANFTTIGIIASTSLVWLAVDGNRRFALEAGQPRTRGLNDVKNS